MFVLFSPSSFSMAQLLGNIGSVADTIAVGKSDLAFGQRNLAQKVDDVRGTQMELILTQIELTSNVADVTEKVIDVRGTHFDLASDVADLKGSQAVLLCRLERRKEASSIGSAFSSYHR